MTGNQLTAIQVAERLGVRIQTIYAYVSRGLLTRRLAADGRTSLFDPAEVERLALRGRPRTATRRAGAIDVVLTSGISQLRDGQLSYRGHDVTELAYTATFEAVAELLWTGQLYPSKRSREGGPKGVPAGGWDARPSCRRAARAALDALDADLPVAERLAVVTAAVAAAEPARTDLRPAAVADQTRNLLSNFAEALPRLGPVAGRGDRPGIAGRLWPRLSPLSPSRPRIQALDAALVLLADNELATSTLAARVAASTHTSPHAVVLAGLATASGPLHGKAAVAVHQMLDDAVASGDAEGAVAQARHRAGQFPVRLSAGELADLTAGERAEQPGGVVPGFGHLVYSGPDPRGACLLHILDPLLTRRARVAIDGVRAAVARTTPRHANVDFALGALGHIGQMPLGHTEAIFIIARTAGWIAHALEEYQEGPLRYRARALYTGE